MWRADDRNVKSTRDGDGLYLDDKHNKNPKIKPHNRQCSVYFPLYTLDAKTIYLTVLGKTDENS